MIAETATSGFTQEAFDQFLAARQEPAWLTDQRVAYWKAFCQRDYPTSREEEWMRTDLRMFHPEKFGLAQEETPETDLPEALLAQGVDLGGRSTTVDSRSINYELASQWSEKGVLFGSLEALVNDHSDLVQKHLMTKAVNPHHDKFSLMHAACWAGGQFLYVPRGVVVDQPLHALSVLTPGGSDFGHTLVILEDDAEATLLAESASTDQKAAGLHCGGIELIAGRNARLRYVNLQNWGLGVWHFAHQKGLVGRDGTLQWTIGALGSRLAKVNQHVGLVGEGAQCQVNGAMFTEGKQHLSYHTLQHHLAPHCHSDLLYKGALQDKSRVVWRGMIEVDQGAQKTNGYQRNDNLLLTPDARADSIPGLEIQADDVRCTHGSTTGRVDDELIFYAQNRGYTRKEAIRMIVSGFFQTTFDRITIESVREALSQAISRRVRDYQ